MDHLPAKSFRTTWIGFSLIALILGGGLILKRLQRDQVLESELPVYSQLSDFRLTNQLGQVVTRESLLGKIWVADVIFSRCGGPCPEMTKNMRALRDSLEGDESVHFVSITTDPDFDSPEILMRYAKRYGAGPDGWSFLTGSKKEIFQLAVDGLKLTAIEKAEGEQANPDDLFIHSTIFVVVDQKGRLRAAIPGLEPGAKEKTLDTIQRLRLQDGL